MQMEKTSYLFTVCNQNFQKKGKKNKERKKEWKKKKPSRVGKPNKIPSVRNLLGPQNINYMKSTSCLIELV